MASLAETPAADNGGVDRVHFELQVHAGARLAGRYRLDRELRSYAESGSPEPQSWVGFDELLNRKVGIDLIASRHPHARAVAAAARDAATVPDVRFVQILDVADEDGLVYVVKEWVSDATDLATRLAGGPLSVALATRIAKELAVAIAEAHSCGIPHGALDPQTVLITRGNQVKIIGLRLETALSGGEARTGTYAADLRAIGTLWYAALTGRWPEEQAAFGLLAAPRTHGKPFSPAQIRAAVPKPVDQLVAQVLDASAEDAPSIESAKALTAMIRALPRLREESAEATSVMPRTAMPAAPQSRPAARAAVRPAPTLAQSASVSIPGPEAGRFPRGVLAVVLGVILVIGAVAAFQLGGSNKNEAGVTVTQSPSPHSTPASPNPVKLLSITTDSVWDSDKGTDNVAHAADAFNGSTTGWMSSTYIGGPAIAPYRAGAGLIFDLGSAQSVGSVKFDVGISGATAEVWTAPSGLSSPPAVTNSAPTGFTRRAIQAGLAAGEVDVSFSSPVKTRFVLIWFTVLPHQDATSDDIAGYRDNLSGVRIYS